VLLGQMCLRKDITSIKKSKMMEVLSMGAITDMDTTTTPILEVQVGILIAATRITGPIMEVLMGIVLHQARATTMDTTIIVTIVVSGGTRVESS